MISASETLINKVRVPAGRGDPLWLRLRLRQVLANLSLTPSGLSPAAIVCIRRLRDPRPGLLDLSANTFQPAFDWERAVTEKVEQLVSQAARAPCDPIPANAECVVFADKADLLASLAGDWCDGRVANRWWWQALLKRSDVAGVWWSVWRNAPEYIPAALQHLANGKRAVEFARALSATESLDLTIGIARSFALQALLPLLQHERFSGSRPLESTAQLRAPGDSLRASWRSWVPESTADGLEPAQQLFLGVPLLLHRAPAIVRSPDFAAAVDSWQREAADSMTPGVDGPAEITNTDGQRRTLDEECASPLNLDGLDRPTAPLPGPADSPEQLLSEVPPITDDDFRASQSAEMQTTFRNPANDQFIEPQSCRTDDDQPALLSELAKDAERSADADTHEQAIEPDIADRNCSPEAEVIHPSRSETAAEPAAITDQFAVPAAMIDTQLGGLFYLINLALYLGLYADFTEVAARTTPGFQLGIWDFVALVGRELVGDSNQTDPVWALLAQLAARASDDAPGRDFEPDDQWRLPVEWLEPFSAEGRCVWTTAGGRLRVLHPDQFLLLDVPLQLDDPHQQLQREMNAYQSFEFRVSKLELPEDPALALVAVSVWQDESPGGKTGLVSPPGLWLARLMPYVRARLRAALGAKGMADSASLLISCAAKVIVTATHLEVFLSLAELPVEIRFAGLDRNPGWVPAAGRFIAFHFD